MGGKAHRNGDRRTPAQLWSLAQKRSNEIWSAPQRALRLLRLISPGEGTRQTVSLLDVVTNKLTYLQVLLQAVVWLSATAAAC